MSNLTPITLRLADAEDKLALSAYALTHYEQTLQARRHTAWARRWAQAAMASAEPADRPHLSAAAKHLRKAMTSIEAAAE